jgi:hypothetical protein
MNLKGNSQGVVGLILSRALRARCNGFTLNRICYLKASLLYSPVRGIQLLRSKSFFAIQIQRVKVTKMRIISPPKL